MEFLVAEHTLSFAMWLFFVLLGLNTIILTSIVLVKYIENLKISKEESDKEKATLYILEFIESGRNNERIDFVFNDQIQLYMQILANQLDGDEKQKLKFLYFKWGYFKKDLMNLARKNSIKQAMALSHLRNFSFELPDDVWERILNHPNAVFRWAVMEYLIETKGNQSLLWFARFFAISKNSQNNICAHLFSCLCAKYPNVFFDFLSQIDDHLLINEGIKVLSAYPIPKAERFIREYIEHNTKDDETYIAAVKAIGALSSEETIKFFKEKALLHNHWVVRLEVAKALQNANIESDKVYRIIHDILDSLLLDSNYFVRRTAVESLSIMIDLFEDLVEYVLSDKDHPSYTLLIEQVNRQSGAA